MTLSKAFLLSKRDRMTGLLSLMDLVKRRRDQFQRESYSIILQLMGFHVPLVRHITSQASYSPYSLARSNG
ncbi:unnamed protein product [Nezara viridula]|uniref:Uncharacterized protein n=1 Tax=Nezara viridula TaxID=85310 RepID=A0A9P0HU58_NEZVI|nr:unnamed protein product [Nezara viridula]